MEDEVVTLPLSEGLHESRAYILLVSACTKVRLRVDGRLLSSENQKVNLCPPTHSMWASVNFLTQHSSGLSKSMYDKSIISNECFAVASGLFMSGEAAIATSHPIHGMF